MTTTESRLLDALERLVSKKPNTRQFQKRLKENKPLKITKSGVEKEAGLSNGSTKHYPDIILKIEKAEAERLHGSQTSRSDDIRSSALYKQLEAKLERALKGKKEAEVKVDELKEECERKDRALNEKISEVDELITSMWKLIPQETLKGSIIKDAENIIPFKKS